MIYRLVICLWILLLICPNAWAGASRAFPNADEVVSITSTDALKVGDGDCTFAIWMNEPSFSGYEAVWDKGAGGGREYSIFINTTTQGYIEIGSAANSGTGLTFDTAWVAGTWQHMAVRRSGTAVTIYGQGLLVETVTRTGTATNDSPIALGQNTTTGGGDLEGKLAYFHVYDRALSVAEISEIMYHPCSIVNGLQACLPLWGSDSPEIDLSGNGHTGAVTGADEDFDGPPVFLHSPQVKLWHRMLAFATMDWKAVTQGVTAWCGAHLSYHRV